MSGLGNFEAFLNGVVVPLSEDSPMWMHKTVASMQQRKPRLRRQGCYWFCGTGRSAGGIGRDPKDAYSSWRLANTPGNSLGSAL